MKLVRPNVRRCLDGEEHLWMVVNEDTDIINKIKWQRRWCEKCGVLTQVHINDQQEALVLMNDKNKPHLVLPQIIRVLTKRASPQKAAAPKKTPRKKTAARKK